MINASASNIELLIDSEGGFISSLRLGCRQMCVGTIPLFTVRLRNKEGECFYVSPMGAKCTYDEGSITYTGFEGFSSLSVRLTVKCDEGISWYIEILSVPCEYAVEWVELPKLCTRPLVDNDKDGGTILFPYNEGMLVTDEGLLPRYEPEFPSSGAYYTFPNMVCSQFMAYLFDDIGLYIGAHDPERGLKCVDFYPCEGGLSLQMRLYSGADFGKDFKPDFPVVWKACLGDWKDAANIYREWLESNLPRGLVPTKENKTLPLWYKTSPLIVTYPVRGKHDMDKMEPNALFPYTNALPILKKIKDATNTQIMALLMHWEGTAPWAPPYVWPPYGGVELFNEFRDALHKNGDLLGVYCSGFGYTLKSTLTEYNCEKKIEEENVLKGVCHSPENKPELGRTCTPYQRYGYDICPASQRGREILEEAYFPLLESGVDYAQILDQNHGGGQYMCFAREHDHPPMPGEWMTSNMVGLLSDWRKKAPNMLFGCESGAAEPFIGNLLMSDNRFELNYPFGTPVPLYAFLYHPYVRNFMGNQCGCPFEPKCDTLRYRLAYSFSIGDIMTLIITPSGELMTHWGTHDFESAPNMDLTLRFIKNVMKFYNEEGSRYLYSGRMCIAPEIECEEIEIPLFRGKEKSVLPRLLSSSWEDEIGVAYIVVNPENEPVKFSLCGKEYIAAPLDAMLILKDK
ncbi:MAG: hypothetical protein IJ309_02775 [Clostridia bacterium]|nr:hypothetical protein [Clostridia bacterium]